MKNAAVGSGIVLRGLEKLDAKVRENASRYAEEVSKLSQGMLESLTFFGTAVHGPFQPGVQRAYNVVVLSDMDLSFLQRLTAVGRRFDAMSIASPLIMTPRYIAMSRDTFTLELIEIQQRHAVILGSDPFVDLTFDERDVRHQVERELKLDLLELRQAVLTTSGVSRLLDQALAGVCGDLARTLRGVLWIHGVREAVPALEAIDRASDVLGIPLPTLHAAQVTPPSGWSAFEMIYREIEAVLKRIDVS